MQTQGSAASEWVDGESAYYLKTFTALALADACLDGIEFESCTFVDCDLSSAMLRRCRFIDCSVQSSTLNHVQLSSTRFTNTVFECCRLVGINWTTVDWSRLTRDAQVGFRDCVLNESSFFGLTLDALVLQSCKAHAVDFREARLRAADLTFSDFSNALFGRTDLSEADFSEATNYDIDVLNNGVRHAKFSRFEAVRLLQGLDVEVVD